MIDAHQHFVFPDRVRYPDLERAMPQINRRLAAADLEPELRTAGVDGTILVQAANDLAETRLLMEVAAGTPWVLGAVGWIPLESPDVAAAALAQVNGPELVGVRYLIHREPDPAWLSARPRLDSLRLLAVGLVYELVTLAKGHLENAVAISERVPEVTLVIDHLGSPYVRGNRWEPWASIMSRLAQNSECVVKYSGLDPIDGSVEAYRPYVDYVFDTFGPERIMWASNWPASRLGGSYQLLVDDCLRLLPELTPTERELVFDATARRTYRLPPAPGTVR
ncbi:MAG TPA: amidohydrolase family protein [Frankiaceae bacterium]|nr:amidohydrolase family protein [Frankiaceae bacterium]